MSEVTITLEKLTKERDAYYKRGVELSKECLKIKEAYDKEIESHKKTVESHADQLANSIRHQTQSHQINEVYTAFSLAQGEFPAIIKDKQGYGYKYANFSVLLATILPILSKHGLSFTQVTTPDNVCHTRIQHKSGQFFESQYIYSFPTREEFKLENKKISYQQELGTVRTYTKKYEAFGILGIHPEDDQDGA